MACPPAILDSILEFLQPSVDVPPSSLAHGIRTGWDGGWV
jgi:hypothetical protein